MKNTLKDLKIELIEYSYQCSDGCCTNYGTIIKVNVIELELELELELLSQDTATILQQVLEHLGYNAVVTQTFDNRH